MGFVEIIAWIVIAAVAVLLAWVWWTMPIPEIYPAENGEPGEKGNE